MTTKKATKTISNAVKQAPALEAPQANNESREALVKKAQAAKQAAALGLIPQEQADALWAEAQAACKPSPEAVAKAEAAKREASEADKIAKAAKAALVYGLITEEKVSEAVSKAEAAGATYKEAAREAKGFSFGGGGGVRFKGQMSGLDAAYKVLSESDQPLNAGAITKAALESGLWAPEGQTPAMTLSAALQADVKKGEKARFEKVGAGLYKVRRAE